MHTMDIVHLALAEERPPSVSLSHLPKMCRALGHICLVTEAKRRPIANSNGA